MGMVGDNGYEEVNRNGHAWPCKGGGDRHDFNGGLGGGFGEVLAWYGG